MQCSLAASNHSAQYKMFYNWSTKRGGQGDCDIYCYVEYQLVLLNISVSQRNMRRVKLQDLPGAQEFPEYQVNQEGPRTKTLIFGIICFCSIHLCSNTYLNIWWLKIKQEWWKNGWPENFSDFTQLLISGPHKTLCNMLNNIINMWYIKYTVCAYRLDSFLLHYLLKTWELLVLRAELWFSLIVS